MTNDRPVIKVITFDLDNTLWDVEPTLLRAEQAQNDWLRAHRPRLMQRYNDEQMRDFRFEFRSHTGNVSRRLGNAPPLSHGTHNQKAVAVPYIETLHFVNNGAIDRISRLCGNGLIVVKC